MITIGVDAGLETIKVVVLKDGAIVGKAKIASGGAGRAKAADAVFSQALAAAGIEASDVSKVMATGQGKFDVSFADGNVVESVADGRAARFFKPDATSIVDIGAVVTRVVTLGEDNNITEVVLNQKCMGGLGLLIETIALRLGMSIEEISGVGIDDSVKVNDGCPVFAELCVLELLNKGVAPAKVAGAVIHMVAVRLNSILNDKIVPSKNSTVLVGGVAKNAAVIKELEKLSGIDFVIPEDSEFCGAIGAALIAVDQPA